MRSEHCFLLVIKLETIVTLKKGLHHFIVMLNDGHFYLTVVNNTQSNTLVFQFI